MASPRVPRCAPRWPRCAASIRRASWSRCRWLRAIPAKRCATRPTRSSAHARPSRSTRWASGTRISSRPATKRSGSYSTMANPIASAARELTGGPQDYDALLELVGDARFVLIGEASHGTHEFYRERARITKRLITEKGFNAVAIEGDWPSAFRVNRYVRAASEDKTAIAALGDFARFPTWMWRNADVVEFVEWLRGHNDSLPAARRAGFYGLDLYSLYHSMAAVVAYLERADPPAAKRARQRYACLDHYGKDSQSYGYATAFGASKS